MELLIDWFGFDNIRVLSEDKSSGTMRLSGVCQRAEIPNRNKRIYPKSLLERELKKLTPLIRESRLVGELDHPTGPTISLRNASHMITEAYFKGNDVLCEIVLLNTPAGKVAQELVKDGVKLGISSRALGSLDCPNNEGNSLVSEDLNLITWDLVADPSTEKAFVGINESTNYTTEIQQKISDKIRERQLVMQLKSRVSKNLLKEEVYAPQRLNELSASFARRIAAAGERDIENLGKGVEAAEKRQAGGFKGEKRSIQKVIKRREEQIKRIRNYAVTGKAGTKKHSGFGRIVRKITKPFRAKQDPNRKPEIGDHKGLVGSQLGRARDNVVAAVNKKDKAKYSKTNLNSKALPTKEGEAWNNVLKRREKSSAKSRPVKATSTPAPAPAPTPKQTRTRPAVSKKPQSKPSPEVIMMGSPTASSNVISRAKKRAKRKREEQS